MKKLQPAKRQRAEVIGSAASFHLANLHCFDTQAFADGIRNLSKPLQSRRVVDFRDSLNAYQDSCQDFLAFVQILRQAQVPQSQDSIHMRSSSHGVASVTKVRRVCVHALWRNQSAENETAKNMKETSMFLMRP